MRALFLHSDFIEIEVTKKAIKWAEEIDKDKIKVEDCLVVFIAVEKEDENCKEKIIRKFIENLNEISERIGMRGGNIVLYPYVHLTNKPSNPKFALDLLKELEKLLREEYNVIRAPFGWYKKFIISVKGHPLAESSRVITCNENSDS